MTPYYDQDGITLYHGDCREVLPVLSGRRFGLVTDPPYGIAAAKGKAHSSIRDNPRWPVTRWDDQRQPEALSLAMTLADDAAVWGGNYYADILPVSGGWLAWIKPEAGTGFSLADMELCWTNREMSARIKHAPRRDGNLHPTQKPVEVMAWTAAFVRGDVLLDPFAGSGTTLVAAKLLGRKAVGVEAEERYCEIAAKRLAQGVLFGTAV